ncbi:uncharacterized protein LOC134471849 [Cavia porcellus]|uniref:uncharacterized protein LOC134471849 n=1 Tax=Cavia porcellus TaxID=10141 RepID=UPI002FE0A609
MGVDKPSGRKGCRRLRSSQFQRQLGRRGYFRAESCVLLSCSSPSSTLSSPANGNQLPVCLLPRLEARRATACLAGTQVHRLENLRVEPPDHFEMVTSVSRTPSRSWPRGAGALCTAPCSLTHGRGPRQPPESTGSAPPPEFIPPALLRPSWLLAPEHSRSFGVKGRDLAIRLEEKGKLIRKKVSTLPEVMWGLAEPGVSPNSLPIPQLPSPSKST